MNAGFDMPHYSTQGASAVQQRTRHPDFLAVNPYVGESDRVREILGISPNADSEYVQRTLASLVQTLARFDNNQHHPQSEPAYRPSADITPHYVSRQHAPGPYGGADTSDRSRRAEPFEERTSNVGKTSSALCDLVRKWNLRFDGRRDAVSFLERLEELREAYSLMPEEVLKAMPELLHGQALLWHRNNRDLWTNFAEFRRMFESQFFPPGYRRNLDEEIRKRTQGEAESFRDFVIALTTLIRRSGEYSNQQKLNLVYANMRPEYKFMIRRQDFSSLTELIERAEEFEELVRERKTFRPPPPASQALVPETAYVARRRNDRSLDIAVLDSLLPETLQPQPRPVSQPSQTNNSRPKSNERGHGKRVTFDRWADRQRGGDRSPGQRDPTQRSASPEARSSRTEPMICWNCDAEGHLYRHCRRPKVMRCFNCKREGVATTRCDCRSGNANRTQVSGGHLSPQRPSVAQPPRSGRGGSNA